jgi:hypothetical protein
VIASNGYVGLTTAMEIAYAHSKGKEVISSEQIEDLAVRSLVSGVMKPEELVDYIKTFEL